MKATSARAPYLIYFFIVLASGLLLFGGFLARLAEKSPLLMEIPVPGSGEIVLDQAKPGPGSKTGTGADRAGAVQVRTTTNVHDFVLLYAAGKMANETIPAGSNLYDCKHFNEVLARVTQPLIPCYTFRFQYPPFVFALLRPLALLELNQAWMIWALGGIITQALCTLWLLDKKKPWTAELTFVLTVTLMSFPSFSNFFEGQTAAFLLLGLTALFCLTSSNKAFAAGLISSLAFLKVQYAPAFIVCGLCTGKSKYLQGMILAVLILSAAALIAAGWPNILAFPCSILSAEAQGGGHLDPGVMANFRGFLHLVLHLRGTPELVVAGVAYLAALALNFYIWTALLPRLSATTGHSFKICAALTTLLMLMFAIHSCVYDYIAAVIPCLWLWGWLREEKALAGSATGRCLRLLLLGFPVLTFPSLLVTLTNGQGWYICFLWALAVCAVTVALLKRTVPASGAEPVVLKPES